MPAFRFAAKRVFLTYSDVCPFITKEAIYYAIDERYPIKYYALGEELHQSGGRHVHAVLEFQRKVSSVDTTLFDVPCAHHQHHPNIQSIKKGQAHWDRTLDYATKEDPIPFANVEVKPTWSELMDQAQSKIEFLELVRKHYPRDYALNLQRLEYAAEKTWPEMNPNTISTYANDYAITLPQELITFVPQPLKSIVVVGPAGCGKTTWAKLVAPKPTLFIRHLDSLQHLREHHKSIVFDDLDFHHLPPPTQKFLVDQENISEIHIRYKVATIPAGIMRIFTANADPFNCISPHREAINRRCTFINLY